ncbi:unnamed protein product [Adineta ricciae]|uniref:Uncharacterized protein n=1 Tax=Adineta ricciae TaxID=249248 RepID=A0A815JL95_ADIRI|nr:unnamed protein product [Adineta ricciae]
MHSFAIRCLLSVTMMICVLHHINAAPLDTKLHKLNHAQFELTTADEPSTADETELHRQKRGFGGIVSLDGSNMGTGDVQASQSTIMNSFNVYCLLLCSMIIFAVHQSNAAAIDGKPLLDHTEEPLTASSPSPSTLPANHRVRRQSIQCGNGVITISGGAISCAGK